MSKRGYVKKFVEKASTDMRKYLRGHGIKKDMINVIAERADIVAKLAILSYNSATRTKYTAGLQYKKGMISMVGYKNYATFNVKCRADIEEFIEGMSEADQNEFKNNTNIMVIACKPDADVCADPEEQIKTGPSEIITFNQAIRADQRALGAQFIIMVMFSPSYVATPEAEKQPKKIKRITADEQRKRMELKKAKKIAAIRRDIRNNKAMNRDLQNRKKQLTGDLSSAARQIARLRKIFGQNIGQQIDRLDTQRLGYDNSITMALASASENDKALAKAIMAARKRGAAASTLRTLAASFDNRALAAMLLSKVPTTGTQKFNALAAAKREQLRKINKELIPLVARLKDYKDNKLMKTAEARSTYNRVRLLQKKAAELRGALAVYRKNDNGVGFATDAIARKTELLKNVNQRMNKYLAQGKELDEALAKAMVAEGVAPQESAQIVSQVAQQIAEGVPGQHAVMQAIQDNVNDDEYMYGD